MIKINSIFVIMIMLLLFTGGVSEIKSMNDWKYAVAKLPTPVLYTPGFDTVFGGENGITLKLNDYGIIDELEFVALPGTVFIIESVIENNQNFIYKVNTEDYPYHTEKGYYIDSRFVVLTNVKQDNRPKILPPPKQILTTLRNMEGAMYTWGGNYCRGIPEILSFYPPSEEISPLLMEQWILKGVDCSGLLYEATNGCTPRNTSSLITFGSPVTIEGLSAAEIAEKLHPLDIIIWKNHMMVVLDNDEIIESSYSRGIVTIYPILEKLQLLFKERIPVDDYDTQVNGKKFIVRRWL